MTADVTSAHAENLGLVQYIPSNRFGDEDIACAEYMRGEITLERARERVVASDTAQKLLRNEESAFPRSDLGTCLRQAAERFVMEVRPGETPIVEKVSL